MGARQRCAEILRDDPCNGGALHLMGAVCACEGNHQAAEEYFRRAIVLEPQNAVWLRDLGVVYVATGNWSGASAVLSRCLALNPGDVSAARLQARVLCESGEADAALPVYEEWTEAEPRAVQAWLGAARCLLLLDRLAAALAPASAALELEPGSIAGHQLLAHIHAGLYEHEQVLVHRLELVRLLPGDWPTLARCAAAYYDVGETNTAVAMFRDAIAGGLGQDLHAAFLQVLLHQAGSTGELLLKEHREWARRHATFPGAKPVFSNPPLAGRRMRIGYVCAESADSPVFRFLAPLLRNHDRNEVEVRLYCTDGSLDGCAAECGVREAELKVMADLTEKRIAERIRRDQIDILVDYSGHNGQGSSLITAMRAAPVQVSCPHYPASSGIPQMDYIFTDRWTCPDGQERQYSETPYRLEAGYLVFDPPLRIRRAAGLPAERAGSVTFGMFQRPGKLNSLVWDAVAEILKQVKNSKLLVHHASAELDAQGSASRGRIVAGLEDRGVDSGRVCFRGIVPLRDHVRLISSVDIALDSFPYTGTTTTCDCLWMGVPVVTLAGDTHVSRASAGLLMRAGLGDLVARDAAEYVAIAVRVASDLTALAGMRKTLRRRVRAAGLIDGARFAREAEAAYRWMWQQRFGSETGERETES